jgi:hypothetical protein
LVVPNDDLVESIVLTTWNPGVVVAVVCGAVTSFDHRSGFFYFSSSFVVGIRVSVMSLEHFVAAGIECSGCFAIFIYFLCRKKSTSLNNIEQPKMHAS